MFNPPPPPEPARSWYWQKNDPPYDVKRFPDGLPGPPGYHYITHDQADAFYKSVKKTHTPVCFTSPPNAPAPSDELPPIAPLPKLPRAPTPTSPSPPSPLTGSKTPERRRRTAKHKSKGPKAKKPRVARFPRKPRTPRPPRVSRAPRKPRKPRTPRRPRNTRTPRAPRRNGTKGGPHTAFCHIWIGEGPHDRDGEIYGGRDGNPPFPAGQGWIWIPAVEGFPCKLGQCKGPLAPVLNALLDLLPHGWRPRIDPRAVEKATRRIEDRRRRYQELAERSRLRRRASPSGATGSYRHVFTGGYNHMRSGEIYAAGPDGNPPFPAGQGWIWEPV